MRDGLPGWNGRASTVNNVGKNLALLIVIGLLVVALFNLFQTSSSRGPQSTLAFSDFVNDVNTGRVADVTIQGNNISGHFSDGRAFTTYAPNDPNLVNRLAEKSVRITAAPVDENVPPLFGVLISWLPMFLLLGVWIFFMRHMQGAGGRAMGFGKSRAGLLTDKPGIRCSRCGTDCPAGMKFCGRCGVPLDPLGPRGSVALEPDTAKPQTP